MYVDQNDKKAKHEASTFKRGQDILHCDFLFVILT